MLFSGSALADADPLGGEAPSSPRWGVRDLGPGWSPSLAVDDLGVPAVSVTQGVADPGQDRGDTTPVVYWNDGSWGRGSGWIPEHVGIVPDRSDGFAASLAFQGPTAQLVFTSQHTSGPREPPALKIATKSGMGWQVETLDDGVGTAWIWQVVHRTSDKADWVVYSDPTNTGALRLAKREAGRWDFSSFPIPHAVTSSIDFGVSDPGAGKLVLGVATTSLGAGSGGGLYFTTSHDEGATWEPPIYVDDTHGMIGPQIAYSGSNPMISYTELDAREAKFAFSPDGGVTWKYETVSPFDSNPGTGLAVSPTTGEPVLAITARDFSANESRLYVARRGFLGTWTLEVVDAVDLDTGLRFAVKPRIMIDANDRVLIAYEVYNAFNGDTSVRFAWSDPDPVVIVPPGPGSPP